MDEPRGARFPGPQPQSPPGSGAAQTGPTTGFQAAPGPSGPLPVAAPWSRSRRQGRGAVQTET